jgi:hypothetical protein
MNLESSTTKKDIDSHESDSETDLSEDPEDPEDPEDESEDDSSDNVINDTLKEDGENTKKKRGRKKKIIDENIQVEKIQKKRGRKPKIKDNDECEKVAKKRGRKPKEKVYSVKELPKTFFDENKNEALILHLPIKISDMNNHTNPQPNMKNEMSYSIYNEQHNNYKVNELNLLPTQDNFLKNNENNISNTLIFNDKDNELFYNKNNSVNYVNYNSNIIDYTDYNNIIEKNVIDNKQFHIEKYEKNDEDNDENKTNRIFKKKLKNILYEFINANNDKTWPETTSTYCWWCCHPFSWMPCALPEYYKKEKFYVNGCFCSFNCTASYNFSKNDDDIWERYSLLNLMYKKLYNEKFIKINLAPPREILKIFGGYLTIEEFRENSFKNDKTFTVVKPPLISIIPKIEENISNTAKNNKSNFPLVNENILNKTHTNLKLKRNKPITNPNNTLQSFMDLKIV